MKKLPIKIAKSISEEYNQDQVVIVTYERKTGVTSVVTYGKSIVDCEQAAMGGNFVKKALGWPDDLCHDKPNRIIKKDRNENNNERNQI